MQQVGGIVHAFWQPIFRTRTKCLSIRRYIESAIVIQKSSGNKAPRVANGPTASSCSSQGSCRRRCGLGSLNDGLLLRHQPASSRDTACCSGIGLVTRRAAVIRVLSSARSSSLSHLSLSRNGWRPPGSLQIKVPQAQIKGHGRNPFLISLGRQPPLSSDFRLRLGIDSPYNDPFAVGKKMDAPEHVSHFNVHAPARLAVVGDFAFILIFGFGVDRGESPKMQPCSVGNG
mmetsp:Transcript_20565/g.51146  ORF Transcript_20565/g.51146 Transcript_20565/m.51146 type:complete len:230 (+) Transcript_20565:1402-2091(+)